MEAEDDVREPFLANKEEDISIERDIQASIREGFIAKVFGIVAFQMVLLFIIVFIGFSNKTFHDWLLTSKLMYILTFIIFMVCLIAPIISPALYRKVPLNYILLTVFTISYSWWIAGYTILYTKASVLVALFLTVVMVLCLTIYAFYKKTDFTTLGGFLFTALILLLVCSLIQIFIYIPLFNMIIIYAGLIVFCIYLIYDVQLIVGKNNIKFSEDDYILAAINLYVDIIAIFIRILDCVGTRDN